MREFLFEDKTINITDLMPDSNVEPRFLLLNVNLCGMPGQSIARELIARSYVRRNLRDIEAKANRNSLGSRSKT